MFEADRKRIVAFYTDADPITTALGWYPDWVDGEMFNVVGTESKEV